MDPMNRRRLGRRTTTRPGGENRNGGDFAQLALWMAAGLAGMLTAVLLARGPLFDSMLRKVGRGRRSRRKPSLDHRLPMLAHAIVGASKSTVESVLGPPRSAAVQGVGVVVRPKMVFWQSDMWYYPLPRDGPTAMAIEFSDDLVRRVEFFTAPC